MPWDWASVITVTNTAHGCATSEECRELLHIPPAWGNSVYGSKDDFKTDLNYSALVDWAAGKRPGVFAHLFK